MKYIISEKQLAILKLLDGKPYKWKGKKTLKDIKLEKHKWHIQN